MDEKPQSQRPAGAQPDHAGSEAIDRSLRVTLARTRRFLSRILDIHRDANIDGTIETIQKDMVFQGPNVWVLVCSIFIASIGLNTNSAAVIIGAMLISPLMGPILGIGLSVGMNDFDTLRRAARHFVVMMVIALATSTLYFVISPLGDAQSELLARTRPTLLDAAIAVFGGIAGIIGVSRRDRGNVIPGVAIATALMPPLCTAGYGLANLNWPFFFGAFYLFCLNSIFIAISTVGIVRYLRFPVVQHVDVESSRRVTRRTAAFITVVLLPSAWVFYGVVAESLFRRRASEFVAHNLMTLPGVDIVNARIEYGDTLSRIEVFLAGDTVPAMLQAQLETRMAEAGLDNTLLRLHQPRDVAGEMSRLSSELRVGIVQDLYERNALALADREQRIGQLEARLAQAARDTMPVDRIARELDAQYPRQILGVAFARLIDAHLAPDSSPAAANAARVRMDTIPTFMITWNGRRTSVHTRLENQIAAWLKVRLALDTVRVMGS
jgi:uncharacterized hydrophobic protein (TIGR00271 family)